jgi:hypothetical protein
MSQPMMEERMQEPKRLKVLPLVPRLWLQRQYSTWPGTVPAKVWQ